MDFLYALLFLLFFFFFFQAEDGIRDLTVTGVQTCALPISPRAPLRAPPRVHAQAPRALRGQDRRAGAAASRRTPRTQTRPARVARGRSEERRVGKECRSRWAAYHEKKKERAHITRCTYVQPTDHAWSIFTESEPAVRSVIARCARHPALLRLVLVEALLSPAGQTRLTS